MGGVICTLWESHDEANALLEKELLLLQGLTQGICEVKFRRLRKTGSRDNACNSRPGWFGKKRELEKLLRTTAAVDIPKTPERP